MLSLQLQWEITIQTWGTDLLHLGWWCLAWLQVGIWFLCSVRGHVRSRRFHRRTISHRGPSHLSGSATGSLAFHTWHISSHSTQSKYILSHFNKGLFLLLRMSYRFNLFYLLTKYTRGCTLYCNIGHFNADVTEGYTIKVSSGILKLNWILFELFQCQS